MLTGGLQGLLQQNKLGWPLRCSKATPNELVKYTATYVAMKTIWGDKCVLPHSIKVHSVNTESFISWVKSRNK